MRPMLRLFVTLVLVVGLLVPSLAAAGPGEKGRPWAQDPPANEVFKATEPPELTVDPLPRETTSVPSWSEGVPQTAHGSSFHLAVSLRGNGSNLSVVKARIADLFGNAVTSFTGTVTFEIVSGNDLAFLQTTSAPIVGGEADDPPD